MNDDDKQNDMTPEPPGMATSRSVDLIRRPAWTPPPRHDPRAGADDCKSWPSKGGD